MRNGRPVAMPVLALLSIFLLAPAAAYADTILPGLTITGGNLVWNGGAAQITLTGSGFSLQASGSPPAGIFDPWNNCGGTPDTCGPGKTVSLYTSFNGNDLPGTASFQGTTYRIGGFGPDAADGSVQFSGSFVAPPLTGGQAFTMAPFTLTGSFTYPKDATGATVSVLPFSGRGTASIWLDPGPIGGYRLARIRYDISPSSTPTPEPASLLLLGGGLAAVIARRRRRS